MPFPLPLVPEVIESQDADLEAVHEVLAVTLIDPDPPEAGWLDETGLIVTTGAAAPAWVTVWVWPPIVTVVVRDVVELLDWTE